MSRISIKEYFMEIAISASKRSTCPRALVGAAVTLDNQLVSIGYNGAPTKQPHCEDIGCNVVHGHCISVVHAEVNAILQSKRDIRGADLYCTHFPCFECCKVIMNAGICSVYYHFSYLDDRFEHYKNTQLSFLRSSGIFVEQVDILYNL